MNAVNSNRDDTQTERISFSRRIVRLFLFGLLGIIGLGSTLYLQAITGIPTRGFTPLMYAVLSLIQPTILLAIAVIVGTITAPKVNLTSHLHAHGFSRETVRASLSRVRQAILLGIGVGILIVALDAIFMAFIAPEPSGASNPATKDTLILALMSIPARFLYGGITEEILLRWGLLSGLAWLGWRLTGQQSNPSNGVIWTAIILSAVVFGLLHLPALAAQASLTPLLVSRTIILNALGGVVFGWLYWTNSLENGMVAHASSHIPLLAVAILTI